MPITENVNGVLHIHSAEPERIGGVIREKDFVHTNDGGVLREIFHANKGATVEGITPLVVAEDHIVIVDSGSFTLSAPAGARIIVGGGAEDGKKPFTSPTYRETDGYGGSGGYVAEYVLSEEIRKAECTVTIGNRVEYGKARTTTTLNIGSTTYDSGNVPQIIQSKWGPIGGGGGQGGRYIRSNTESVTTAGGDGTGAGGGGGSGYYGEFNTSVAGIGGNVNGYGNKGRSGGTSAGGSGGQGGYSAGGGGGGFYSNGNYTNGSGGLGGSGIVVIEW